MLPSIWKRRGATFGPSADDFIERFFYGWPTFNRDFSRDNDVAWIPRVDVNETDKEVTIEAELPGIDKKDVKVEIQNNVLTISGERKSEKKVEEENCYVAERHYGKFERTFTLSDTVDSNKISAEYKNGVLKLSLPKTEKALPKEISVEVK